MEVCKYAVPQWTEVKPEHFCACHLYNDAAAQKKAEEEMENVKRNEKEPIKEQEVL